MSIPNLNAKPLNPSILKQRFLEHLRRKNAPPVDEAANVPRMSTLVAERGGL
jgi:hypothetical protein